MHSCADNTLFLITLGIGSCTGDESCSLNTAVEGDAEASDAALNVGYESCQGKQSCRGGSGAALIHDGACSGENSCQEWKVGGSSTSAFSVGTGSCTGLNSCQQMTVSDLQEGYISVLPGACTGANSCQNLTAPVGVLTFSINEGACTEDNSCQNCNGGANDQEDCVGASLAFETSGGAVPRNNHRNMKWWAWVSASLLGAILLQ